MANGPSGRGSDPRKRRSGRSSTSRASDRPAAGPRRGVQRPRSAAAAAQAVRPRFTGRAAVLLLVLALLVVSYASSTRAYLQQRSHLASLRSSIARSQAEVDRLSGEKKRWADPAYVRTAAHQRFGWVMPGEIGFQVIDEDGKALGPTDTLSRPSADSVASRPVWWKTAWGSVVAAGRPETAAAATPRPATNIRAPKVPAKQ